MGYRLWILKATLSRNLLGTKLSLTWENDGAAPFYRDWPVWVYVTDEDGNTIEKKQVELSLSSILPGETIETDTLLDTRKLFELAGENYHISRCRCWYSRNAGYLLCDLRRSSRHP